MRVEFTTQNDNVQNSYRSVVNNGTFVTIVRDIKKYPYKDFETVYTFSNEEGDEIKTEVHNVEWFYTLTDERRYKITYKIVY